MMNLKSYIFRKNIIKYSLLFTSLISLILFFLNFSINVFTLGFSRISNLIGRMFPLDFSSLSSLCVPILETLQVAIFSAILGIVTSLLILPLITNILFKNKIIPKICSAILSVFRTIPFLIIAAILVSLFSTGSFSGFLSLYIISVLIASKMLKEYIEEIDKKHLEAMEVLGVSKFIIYRKAILSNIRPMIYSIFFLVLESNIRGASVLGLVGAGGIGQKLWEELNHLRYDRVSLIILILVILILIIDLISLYARNYEVNKTYTKQSYLRKKSFDKLIIFSSVILSLFFSFKFINITPERFFTGVKQLKALFSGLFSPDISYFPKMFEELLFSMSIALTSTLLAGITAILVSYFAALNLVGRNTAIFTKIIINIFRTFPPIIVALIFFRGFGPGYISSFFALYIYTLGVISKMYSEVLESIDENIIDGVKSMGLRNFIGYIKIIFGGYFAEFISILLYRFEMNIKNSTILGMVGAGGIGHLLTNNIEFRNWNRISTLLIGLCTAIIIVENISYIIRIRIKK